MWRFLLGFSMGVYVNQQYKIPDIKYWVEWMKDQEKNKRK